jgi:hydrogenase-4 component B
MRARGWIRRAMVAEWMSAEPYLWPVAALVLSGLAAVPAPRCAELNWAVYGVCLAASLALLGLALVQLVSGIPPVGADLPIGLPWLRVHVRVDALSAFFLVIVSVGAAAASLFGLAHGRHETAPGRVLPFYPLFLAGMALVPMADDAFTFLFAWEVMSLASWALVMAHHREPEQAQAGFVYLVMAGFGTLALLTAFGLLIGTDGGYDFATLRSAAPFSGPAALVLVLVLLGAGSKAGLVPLHAWLPLAHPAAPSHVSALMSGVMTKIAIYGFVRIVFGFLGAPAPWWGGLVLALAGLTAVLGVLYALMQHDLKRLLAYHTVENVGIIFIGLGLALAFQANGLPASAALALTAALFHVLNHMLFKSLLFLGAGSVQAATGERDMDRLGGLIRRMPRTAFVFLIGCAAISALPPLNGFVSEWLTFQAILISPVLAPWGLKFLVPAVGALLALSAVLAAACFVKTYGISFLGRARSQAAERARDDDRLGLAAMFGLAGLCVLAGVLPGLVMDALSPAVAIVNGGVGPVPQVSRDWLTVVPVAAGRSSYNGFVILSFIAVSAIAASYAIHRWASRAVRRGPAWDCGFPDAGMRAQPSASGFAQPLRRIYGSVAFQARDRVELPTPGDLASARLEVRLRDPIWDGLYLPLGRAVTTAAGALNRTQFLTVRRYLGFAFVLLVALLLGLALWT